MLPWLSSDDDPFFSEVSNLIDNIEKGPGSAPILSSYEVRLPCFSLDHALIADDHLLDLC